MSENALGGADSSTDSADKKTCLECGKQYNTTQGLVYHYKNTECSGLECPDCDKSHFTTRFGLVRHYGKNHGGGLSMYPRLQDGEWLREKYVEEGLSTSDIAELVGSAECVVVEWKQRHGIETITDYKARGNGEDNPNWENNTVFVECDYCGQEIEIRKHRKNNSRNNYCDRECQANYASENIRGENHPLYDPEKVIDYGPNFTLQRRKAMKRDQYRCQKCGATPIDLGQEPDAHHLIKISYYRENYEAPEWYEKGNQLSNLVALCRSCHHKWEGIPLRPQ